MKVLVVVDMQNDFIDGSLGTKEAQAIVPNVVEKIKKHEGAIIVTLDTHHDNYLDTQEGRFLPVPHCVEDTDGWLMNDEVLKALKDSKNGYYVVRKPTFGEIRLDELYGAIVQDFSKEIDEVELAGLCTDICVISNALITKAIMPEIPITVDASACAGVTPESHKRALEAMKVCQIKIINE